MNANGDVSVVIPTFNRAHCIRHAVDSVLGQTVPCREVIVVDDGSTDDTSAVLASYGQAVRVIRQENGGVGAARNAGISHAGAKWIGFLDSDDEWEPRRLEWFKQDQDRWPDAVAHVGNTVFIAEEDLRIDHLGIHGMKSRPDHVELIPRPLCAHVWLQFLTSTFIVRRDCLEAEGGFDPSLAILEDFRLLTGVALRGPWVRREDVVARMFRRGPVASNTFAQLRNKSEQMASSCVGTYSRLLSRSELDGAERLLIRRQLSAARAQAAVGARARGGWREAMDGLVQSVVDFPTARTVARAVVGMGAGARGLDVLSRLKRRAPVRDVTGR